MMDLQLENELCIPIIFLGYGAELQAPSQQLQIREVAIICK